VESAPGKIHGIASGIGFLFLMFNPFWALWIQEFSRLRFVNGLVFPLAIMTLVLFPVSEQVRRNLRLRLRMPWAVKRAFAFSSLDFSAASGFLFLAHSISHFAHRRKRADGSRSLPSVARRRS
jgi:hypothetical protein